MTLYVIIGNGKKLMGYYESIGQVVAYARVLFPNMSYKIREATEEEKRTFVEKG